MAVGPYAPTDPVAAFAGRIAGLDARIRALELAASRLSSAISTRHTFTVSGIRQPASIGPVTTNHGEYWTTPTGLCMFSFVATVPSGSAGVAGSAVEIDLSQLPDPVRTSQRAVGVCDLFDAGNTVWTCTLAWVSTSLMRMQVSGSGAWLGEVPSFALAAGDSISASGRYRIT